MPRTKTYSIMGEPQPWVRTLSTCSHKTIFNDQQMLRTSFGLYLAQQHNEEPLFNVPVAIMGTFFMSPPSYTRKNAVPSISKHIKSNLDELSLYLFDNLRGICITDKRIIVSENFNKTYDDNPRTYFIITEIN